jgi:hypothetical protein
MNMSADFVARLGGTEDSDYGNFRFLLNLRRLHIVSKDGIELRRGSLVVVNAIQPNPEEVHGCQWI